MSPDNPTRTIVVTSPSPQEGKTTTAINLGVTMAEAGGRVLIVDTDMRRPRLHRSFGVPNQTGISSVIVSKATLEEAIKRTDVPNLDVLPCGPVPPNPSERRLARRQHDGRGRRAGAGLTERDLYPSTSSRACRPRRRRTSTGDDARPPCWRNRPGDAGSYWCYASLEDVQAAIAKVGYPANRLHYVRGKVEETVPAQARSRLPAAPRHGLVRVDAARAGAPLPAPSGRRAHRRRLRPLEGLPAGDRRVHRRDARLRNADPHRHTGRLRKPDV